MSGSILLAELMCGRLCHDLSGPIGTLSGVMEMLAEGGATAAEARRVADEAAVAVRARLRLLRAAWTRDGGSMEAGAIRALAAGLRTGRRVRVELDELRGAFGGDMARMVLNLLLLGVESLAGNGVLRASGCERGGVAFALDGPRAAWPEALFAALQAPDAAWTEPDGERRLQAALTAILVRAGSMRLEARGPQTLLLAPAPGEGARDPL